MLATAGVRLRFARAAAALAGAASHGGHASPANCRPCPAAPPGLALEYVTLGWNVAGIIVLAIAAVAARSVALAGFGLDSLIEIGASAVVIWELSGTGEDRQRRGLRLIGYAFTGLAVYLLVQSTVVLAAGYRPRHSLAGIVWTAVTAVVMFALAAGKARTGRALGNPVLCTEGRVTLIDGILAVAVLAWPGAERGGRLVAGRPRCRVRAGLLRCAGSAGDLLHRALIAGRLTEARTLSGGPGAWRQAGPAP